MKNGIEPGEPRKYATWVSVYLYVTDADVVRAEWASCGVEGRLGEVRNTDYGMREFGFVDTGRHPAPSGVEVALTI
jgi:hypothetical protein